MAVVERTRAGLRKLRPLRPGGRVAIVAPASPLRQRDAAQFDSGLAELRRLGFDPVHDAGVHERSGYVAGSPGRRARELRETWQRRDVDAMIALRGGYGSVQVLPWLDAGAFPDVPAAFVGYSDVTSLHIYLNDVVGVASIHGPMIDGRIGAGPDAYDVASFLGSLSTTPLGELAPPGVSILRAGEASGPLAGGTLTQLLGSLGTPYAFNPPAGSVLFIDEIGERPYRLDRMLTQLRLSGLLARGAGVVFGQLPNCDDDGSGITAEGVAADALRDFAGPVLFGFPSGHTTSPMVSLPLGAHTRVVATGTPRLVVEESVIA